MDDYTKIALSFNYDFDMNIPLEYNCTLISLTIREGCKCSMFDNKDKAIIKVLPGEHVKEKINFNVSKLDVEYVKIKDSSDNINTITVKEFEKKHGSLKWFIFKELYSQDYMYLNSFENEITRMCFDIIRPFISLRSCPTIKYNTSLISKKANGEYIHWYIGVNGKAKYMTKENILIHELGYFVHDAVFNNRQIRFPIENKGKYAKKNYFENFAECFTDLVYYKIINDRTKKMLKLLEDII